MARDHISQNLRAFYRQLTLHAGHRHQRLGQLELFQDPGEGWPSLMVGMPGPDLLPGFSRRMARGEFPPVLILDDVDEHRKKQLEEAGLRPFRAWEAMHMDPGDYSSASLRHEGASQLQIHARRSGDLEALITLINRELMSALPLGEGIRNGFLHLTGIHWAVGYLGNRPVSGGVLFLHEGVAGLYFIATDSGYRKRGFASELLGVLLGMALDMDAQSLVLHSTSLGAGLYRRAGFRSHGSYPLLIGLG